MHMPVPVTSTVGKRPPPPCDLAAIDDLPWGYIPSYITQGTRSKHPRLSFVLATAWRSSAIEVRSRGVWSPERLIGSARRPRRLLRPDVAHVVRENARVIADALERFQYEGCLHRDVELSRLLHGARDQAAEPCLILRVELLVAGDDFGRGVAIDAIEHLERPAQQADRQIREMPHV